MKWANGSLTRDRWHTGFVDAFGVGGLLGQFEGRTVADVLAWLHVCHLPGRDLHRPNAVADHFHIVPRQAGTMDDGRSPTRWKATLALLGTEESK